MGGAERVDPRTTARSVCPRATWRKRVATASKSAGALCGAVTQEDEATWRARISLGTDLLVHPDRRSACRRNVLMAAIGVDGNGDKHVLAVVVGATENTVRPGLDRQSPRQGLDPTLPRESSMARRHSAKRSETPSVWPSSAARSTRAVTSSSACPNICTRASRRRSVRPGTRTTQTRPSGSCGPASGA